MEFNQNFLFKDLDSGVGNYFRPRATLLLYYCLAGHISVKKANSNFKKFAFAGRMLPPPDLE